MGIPGQVNIREASAEETFEVRAGSAISLGENVRI
jgi:hypothetical protein